MTKVLAPTVRHDQLDRLGTVDLIDQYNSAISSYAGRITNSSPRQQRINYVVDLLSARADDGDQAAQAWLES